MAKNKFILIFGELDKQFIKIKPSSVQYIQQMAGRQITQKVIDFQFSRIQMKDESQHHYYDQKSQMGKFSEWNLNNIINGLGLTDRTHYSTKWVGHDQTSFLDAFIYCLFKGCRNTAAGQNGVFIKLKFNIYQLAAKFLKINDQRIIVQTLCTAQYAKNLPHFLNRNKIIYNLFDKLLKSYLESMHAEYQSEMEDLKLFAKAFNFIKFEIINDSIGMFQHFGQKFYIINEKGCYFIVQLQPERNNVIELKKIIQNQEESDHSQKILESQNILPKFTAEFGKYLNEQPKKIYQYSAPRFIIQGQTKKKRKIRYTELEIKQEQQQQQSKASPTKDKQPPPANSLPNNKPVNIQDFRKTVHSGTSMNVDTKCKSQSKQKLRQRRMYYKSSNKRVKTGLLESTENRREANNSKPKSNEITFDQKQARKASQKKIQLNLRKITIEAGHRQMSNTNSYKQLPKHESNRNLEHHSSNINSMTTFASSINSMSRQRTITKL